MKIPFAEVVSLLHRTSTATLATQSAQLPGYPYATVVPCVVDEAHRPVFLISMLAEHTKNLLVDGRTSLSVMHGGNAQTSARLTMIGDTERFEPSPEMIARYLRYEPAAEQYLELDFAFFRLQPKRIRFIAGVGRMGWLENKDWRGAPQLSLTDEAQILQPLMKKTNGNIRLLGVDSYGIDCELDEQHIRSDFDTSSSSLEKIEEFSAVCLDNLSQ
jgi:hypothetical protein